MTIPAPPNERSGHPAPDPQPRRMLDAGRRASDRFAPKFGGGGPRPRQPSSASTSAAVGNDGSAPSTVTACAPAALARRRLSGTDRPSASDAAKQPQNASPAAVVSTARTFSA